jgi:hypothetical protein
MGDTTYVRESVGVHPFVSLFRVDVRLVRVGADGDFYD